MFALIQQGQLLKNTHPGELGCLTFHEVKASRRTGSSEKRSYSACSLACPHNPMQVLILRALFPISGSTCLWQCKCPGLRNCEEILLRSDDGVHDFYGKVLFKTKKVLVSLPLCCMKYIYSCKTHEHNNDKHSKIYPRAQ